MKTKLIAITAFALTVGTIATLPSCTKVANLLTANVGMQTESVKVTIPATTGVNGVISVGPASNKYNVDSLIQAQTAGQFNASNISSVKLKSVVFTLSNFNALNNFANFESVSATFSSNTDKTPYTITIPTNPDVTTNMLTLPVDTARELKSYIGNEFFYTVEGKLRRPTTIPLECTITFSFDLKVKG
jgi:hypothetical protein